MKKYIKVVNSALLISLLFLNSCDSKKYSQMSDSTSEESKDDLIAADFNKLLSPQNLSFDSETRVLQWDKVIGASKYEININGEIVSTVKQNSYTIPAKKLEVSGDEEVIISIRALNEDGSIKSNFTSFVYDPNYVSTKDTFTYEYDEEKDEYYVNGLNPVLPEKSINNIIIGGEYKGKPVTAIADKAFYKTSYLKKAVITSSIKYIGKSAFESSYVNQITFEEGVEVIDEGAFSRLGKLASDIVIPSTVKEIKKDAFYRTTIKELTFADNSNLEIIGESAFASLLFNKSFTTTKSLYIPASVKSIGKNAFNNSSLTSIILDENIQVTTLSESCFAKNSLSKFTIPSSVEVIEKGAFQSNNNLANVYVAADSNSLSYIGESAFASTKLSYFGYEVEDKPSRTLNFPSSVKEIATSAFQSLSIKQINFESDSNLKTIGSKAFYSNGTIESISLPASLEDIGANAFGNNSKLASVTFADECNLYHLSNSAFASTPFIKNLGDQRIILANSLYAISSADKLLDTFVLDSTLVSIADSIFVNHPMSNITFNDGLKVIGNEAFSKCNSLTDIYLPNSLVEIGSKAFKGCSKIENINLGDVDNSSLTIIGSEAFSNVTAYTTLLLPNSVTTIGNDAFAIDSTNKNSRLTTSFVITENSKLTTLGDGVFSGQSSLTSINIPNGVTSLGVKLFQGCKALQEVNIDIDNSSIETICELAFENTLIKTINIPDSIVDIQSGAFKNCASLEEVNFASLAFASVENASLHSKTFENCSALVELNLPYSIVSIEKDAFYNSKNLEIINSNATEIDNNAFTGTAFVNKLTNGYLLYNNIIINFLGDEKNITLPSSLVGINPEAFSGSSVEVITIPAGLSTIDSLAFANCNNLTKVIFEEGSLLREIGDNAFKNCSNLSEFSLSNTIEFIGEGAFEGCLSLKSIDLNHESLTAISNRAFANCNSLTSVNFGSNITSIGDYAFYQNRLSNVIIPESVEYIGDYAFANNGVAENMLISPNYWIIDPTLVNLTFAENSKLEEIGKYSFAYNKLVSIDLPRNDNMTLGDSCFAYSSELKVFKIESEIVIHEGIIFGANKIEEIELPSNILVSSLFGGNISMIPTSLSKIVISEGSTIVADNAFSGFGMVKEIIVPHSVVEIGQNAFYGCRSLTSLDLSSVVTVGQNAFNGCTSLANITISNSISYIGNKAFFATKYLNEQEDEFVIINNILVKYNGSSSNVVIPSNVVEIAGGAFSGNSDVKEVIFNSNIVNICNGAFDSCYNLKTIDLSNATNIVSVELQTFDTLSSDLKILVAANKLNGYRNNVYWSLYEDLINAK